MKVINIFYLIIFLNIYLIFSKELINNTFVQDQSQIIEDTDNLIGKDLQQIENLEEQVLDDNFGNNHLATNVYEKGNNIIVEMDIPGMVDVNKVDISVKDKVLTISGSREEVKEKKDEHYYQREISSGSFAHSVTLPIDVDDKDATAEYENGILKIILPKKTENKIKVQIK